MRRGRLNRGAQGLYIGGISCACGKVGYDKRGAQTKRNSDMKSGRIKELRIYNCPMSNTWHLTSKV